jgi:predicted HicB family RNase H-like nuclease
MVKTSPALHARLTVEAADQNVSIKSVGSAKTG